VRAVNSHAQGLQHWSTSSISRSFGTESSPRLSSDRSCF